MSLSYSALAVSVVTNSAHFSLISVSNVAIPLIWSSNIFRTLRSWFSSRLRSATVFSFVSCILINFRFLLNIWLILSALMFTHFLKNVVLWLAPRPPRCSNPLELRLFRSSSTFRWGPCVLAVLVDFSVRSIHPGHDTMFRRETQEPAAA